MENDLLSKRKEKFLKIVKKPSVWVISLLIIALILGTHIRSMPMQDHGGRPGLWDIARNDWTLGPDLDPWLFTRQAKIISENGALPEIDNFRNVPLGFVNAKETTLLPYMIYWTWEISNLFGEYSIEFAAALFPVIMFFLTILVFFLFVRESFKEKKGKNNKANAIAIIATFLMITVPAFLARTVAGIPEKESAIFFFMFLAFYLFVKAWNEENLKKKYLLGLLAGVSTALGGLISGLVIYILITISMAALIMFILEKISQENFVAYSLWVISSFGMLALLSQRNTLFKLISSATTGLPAVVLFILVVDAILWKSNFSKSKFLKNSKLPKNIISIITAAAVGFVVVLIALGPEFIFSKIKSLHQELFKAVTGRWNSTVAENRQPFFLEWARSFGPNLNGIPTMFWMFVVGSVVLFKKMANKLRSSDSWKLTGFYMLFLAGLIFSRYSSSSIFNGENFVSKAFYYIATFLLIWQVMKTYLSYRKENHRGFENVSYTEVLLTVLFVLTVFSARSAVRLVMVLGPVGSIFVAFLTVELISRYLGSKASTSKNLYGAFAIVAIILTGFMFSSFNQTIQSQAYNYVPSGYNQQWQKAMDWVRTETPTDAVFGHWWDYGYWVQSIGDRATVLDGGNAISYWNYLMGRHVLTGDNQGDALEFLYNHETDYFLIDSSDIGKYGAFSSIGSDENFDRLGFIPTMVSNQNQIRETATGIQRVYASQIGLDEDIIYDLNGTKIFLPSGGAAMLGVLLDITREGNQSRIEQPIAVFHDGRQEYRIPLRYLEHSGNFIDFGTGLEGAAKIIQSYSQSAGGVSLDEMGGLVYVSPRVMRGFLAQKYIFDDPLDNFNQFSVVHRQPSLIVEGLRSQGAPASEIVIFNGRLQGPITIWKVNYLGDEEVREAYLDKDPTKYLAWEL